MPNITREQRITRSIGRRIDDLTGGRNRNLTTLSEKLCISPLTLRRKIDEMKDAKDTRKGLTVQEVLIALDFAGCSQEEIAEILAGK